jgi:hypothetical protein
MVKIVCKDKVYYDNANYKIYIITSYDNNYQIIKSFSKIKGCWKKNVTLSGFNLNINF